ncbi:hypothetical protein [Ramlibacter sp. AN1015]|uniref:hypothetical protein n=1 Tax=Ramlibacter sp. AN1015 TaxID=3133428 RepID=UPI004040954D
MSAPLRFLAALCSQKPWRTALMWHAQHLLLFNVSLRLPVLEETRNHPARRVRRTSGGKREALRACALDTGRCRDAGGLADAECKAMHTLYQQSRQLTPNPLLHRSGVQWVDALSISVRPVITCWFMTLPCAAKMAPFAACAWL